MFSNIGWTEMLVIAVIAVIFVGPKDLPTMLRTFGGFMRKARGMAGDFQKQVDDALREAELDDVRKSIEDVRSLDPKKALRDKLNPFTEAEAPIFDEEKLPGIDPPVEVDVDAALTRQAELDAAATPNPSAGTNAVPGLAPVKDPADIVTGNGVSQSDSRTELEPANSVTATVAPGTEPAESKESSPELNAASREPSIGKPKASS